MKENITLHHIMQEYEKYQSITIVIKIISTILFFIQTLVLTY